MVPDAPAIDHDLPCAVCNYNLKGLSPDANCPECGQAVARTFAPELTRSSPAWLRRQAGTMFLLAPLALVTFTPQMFGMSWQLAQGLRLATMVVTVYAAARLSAAEPPGPVVNRSDPWRRSLLVATAFCAGTIAYMTFSSNDLDYRVHTLLGLAFIIALAAAHWLVGVYLHRLADRAGDGSLAAHARLVRWAAPGQVLAQTAVRFVAALARDEDVRWVILGLLDWAVAGVALTYVLLLGRLHETLRAAARVAEANAPKAEAAVVAA
jgi:hypothetical protein